MADTDAKLNLSLDDIISKSVKAPKKGGAGSKVGAGKPRGRGTSRVVTGVPVGKSRALGIAISSSTKRAAGPRRLSGGQAPARRNVIAEAAPQARTRTRDPAVPRVDPREFLKIRAAIDGDAPWQHDKFHEVSGGRAWAGGKGARTPAEAGWTLRISNLDWKVTDEDIKELFDNFGTVKRAGLNFDDSGRSDETATVVFAQKVDAERALKEYNGIALDGKNMRIELVPPRAAGGGRVVETLSSGLRLGDRPTRGAPSLGRGQMRSEQPQERRARGRLSGRGRRGGGGDFMEE